MATKYEEYKRGWIRELHERMWKYKHLYDIRRLYNKKTLTDISE